MSEAITKCRLDKWLWAVRLYKSRSQASEACRSAKVKIDGKAVKASRFLAEGEVVSLRKGPVVYSYKVTKLIDKRVGAPIARECYEDITPEEEIIKLKEHQKLQSAFNFQGKGRPTKKDRRRLDQWKDDVLD